MRSVTSVAETDDLNPVCKSHERAGNLLHIMSDTARAAGESDTQASALVYRPSHCFTIQQGARLTNTSVNLEKISSLSLAMKVPDK